MTLSVGQPVQLSSSVALPAGGVRITRTFAEPLPRGESATLAYFDDDIQTWRGVGSVLSPDRLSVSATVHHLSVWTDITGALGSVTDVAKDAWTSGADWAYYQVGKVFDTRVDAPSCTAKPTWVQQATFIATNRNNPVLFCVGHDPAHPNVLDVKARINRGYAFDAYVHVPASWTYNSTFGPQTLDDAIAVVGHLDSAMSQALGSFAPAGSVVVGPGQELSLGLSEVAVRGASQAAVVDLEPPSTVGFLMSTLGQLVGTQLSDLAEGYVAAAMVVAGCYTDVKAADDAGTWSKALLTCLKGLDETAAKTLANYLRKRGRTPAEAGKLAGKIVGRVSVYLALLGPAFSALNYGAERFLDASARTVSVLARPESVTVSTLRSAEVPADCGLPAQRLVDGRTTQGSPGEGWIRTDPGLVGFADFAGLGYRQALAEYTCTAGGVSWPGILVVIGAGGTLLASLPLPDADHEHADLSAVAVQGAVASISWQAYEGAGFFNVRHTSQVGYSAGALTITQDEATYDPQAVAQAVSIAAFDDDRSQLADQAVITDDDWSTLTASNIGLLGDDSCTVEGQTATCLFDPSVSVYVDPDPAPNVMTLVAAPATLYGWRVIGVDVPSPGTGSPGE